jgi:RNase adapter protein RapZ
MTEFAIRTFGVRYHNFVSGPPGVDVRSLYNPYHNKLVKHLSGMDKPVKELVQASPGYDDLISSLLETLIANPEKLLNVYCTGGRHRSVVVAEDLAARLREAGHSVYVKHVDLHRKGE